jgi:hypothetical protein
MTEFTKENDGYKYILNVIDCYSKFAWSFRCLTKTSNEVFFHLESLLLKCFIPKELQSDNGLEFKNRKISSLCRKLCKTSFWSPIPPIKPRIS